jgi:hypothetical protein
MTRVARSDIFIYNNLLIFFYLFLIIIKYFILFYLLIHIIIDLFNQIHRYKQKLFNLQLEFFI